MKSKITRKLALGTGCLMLTFTLALASNLLINPISSIAAKNIIQPMENSPYAYKNIINPMENSPYA